MLQVPASSKKAINYLAVAVVVVGGSVVVGGGGGGVVVVAIAVFGGGCRRCRTNVIHHETYRSLCANAL